MAQELNIELHYTPRAPFDRFHARSQRFACIVAHRRCGKTVACIAELILRAMRNPNRAPRYAYIAPLYACAACSALLHFSLAIRKCGEKFQVRRLILDTLTRAN